MKQYKANVDNIVLNPKDTSRPQLDLLQLLGILGRLVLPLMVVKVVAVVYFPKLIPILHALLTSSF